MPLRYRLHIWIANQHLCNKDLQSRNELKANRKVILFSHSETLTVIYPRLFGFDLYLNGPLNSYMFCM